MESSLLELIMVQLVGPVSIILRNIALPWIFVGYRFKSKNGFWFKFVMDFLFVVMPIILSLTLLSEHINAMLIFQITALFSLIIFSLCEYCFISREIPPLKQVLNQVVDDQRISIVFISYMRSILLIETGVAILAVDFPTFPQRFAKTQSYGLSLMDLGTGYFVICLASFDAMRRKSSMQSSHKRGFHIFRSSATVLLCIGFVRTVLLRFINYPQAVSEYGTHCNFFFLLAFIKIITKAMCRRFHLIIALVFVAINWIVLEQFEIQDWLLSNEAIRDSFFAGNREAFASLIGYLSLYYFGYAIAEFVASTGVRLKSWFRTIFYLITVAISSLFIEKICEPILGDPSRRIANISYVLHMVFLHCISMATFLFVRLVSVFWWAARMPQFTLDENAFENHVPCLLNALNDYALIFFLISNLFTGLINLTIYPMKWINSYHSTGILIVYMFIACAIVNLVYFFKLNRKKIDVQKSA